MKIVYGICISIAAMLGALACKKGNSKDAASGNLELSKTSSLQKGEPVLFTMNAAAGNDVKWTVWPDTCVVINPRGNTASIAFSRAGNFVVTATAGSQSEKREVTVNNEEYTGYNNQNWRLEPLTGDELIITPIKIDTSTNTGVIFTIRTQKQYHCLNNILKYETVVDASGYSIDFKGVKIPSDSACFAGEANSYANINFYPVAAGTHPLSIKLNGVTFNGSITKDNSGVTFVWPYTSGVTFTRLHLPN